MTKGCLCLGLGMSVLMAGCAINKPINEEGQTKQVVPNNPVTVQVPLNMGNKQLMVEVRETEAERALGLSYRTSLGENEGMVFKFDQPAPYSFWMKGMNFPLDMIWVREGKIVDISEQVPAPWSTQIEQPETRTPKEPVDMVVEVNGGWVEKNGIRIGDSVGANNHSP